MSTKNITKHKNGRNVTSKECSNQNLQGPGVLEHFFYLKITNTQSAKNTVDGSEIRRGVMSLIICRAENTCQVGDPRIFKKPLTSINNVHTPTGWGDKISFKGKHSPGKHPRKFRHRVGKNTLTLRSSPHRIWLYLGKLLYLL